tara:strand:- start:1456 stop:2505 length:1050 start_codon:yes stop_codon:yes gene_type:complete
MHTLEPIKQGASKAFDRRLLSRLTRLIAPPNVYRQCFHPRTLACCDSLAAADPKRAASDATPTLPPLALPPPLPGAASTLAVASCYRDLSAGSLFTHSPTASEFVRGDTHTHARCLLSSFFDSLLLHYISVHSLPQMEPIFQQREADLSSQQVRQLLLDNEPSPKNKRQRVMPPRSSKNRAREMIKSIREWETCSESSSLFQRAAAAIDQEFAGLSAEEIDHDEALDDTVEVDDTGSIHSAGDEGDGSDADDGSDNNSFVSKDSYQSGDSDWQPSGTTTPLSNEPYSENPSPQSSPAKSSVAGSSASASSTQDSCIDTFESTNNLDSEDPANFPDAPFTPNHLASYSVD